MVQSVSYKVFFDNYRESVSKTEIDLRFWKHFLSMSIEKYQLENPENRRINQSGFSLYNIEPVGMHQWLHISPETFEIEIKDLEEHRDNFFTWIMNLSIIRIYNSVELLLLQSIQHKYFQNLEDPSKGKKQTNKIISEVKKYLTTNNLSIDSTNNRYLILFLKSMCRNFETFLQIKTNPTPNWKTNWNEFYEFVSTLRNVITHHAMIVTPSIRNNLNSIAGDVFTHYFESPINNSESEILKPKDGDIFLNFIHQINDFVANSVKFIADEPDFKFIGLYKV